MGVLEGVFTVMVTPLTKRGDIDLDGMAKNIDWWVHEGVHGLIALGSTGEFASINTEDRMQVAEHVIDHVANRVPVLIGATAETTDEAITLARHAEEAGASGVLVLPSYYYRSKPAEVLAHFKGISDAVNIPIMVYNNPGSTKTDITPEQVQKLSDLRMVQYIKESSCDIRRIADIRIRTNDELTVFCGWEDLAYESFVMGAKGWVSVAANIVPSLCVRLFNDLVRDNDLKAGWDTYCRLLPVLWLLERSGKAQVILKFVLDQMGLAGGKAHTPRLPLSEREKSEIAATLSVAGVELGSH